VLRSATKSPQARHRPNEHMVEAIGTVVSLRYAQPKRRYEYQCRGERLQQGNVQDDPVGPPECSAQQRRVVLFSGSRSARYAHAALNAPC